VTVNTLSIKNVLINGLSEARNAPNAECQFSIKEKLMRVPQKLNKLCKGNKVILISVQKTMCIQKKKKSFFVVFSKEKEIFVDMCTYTISYHQVAFMDFF